MNHEESGMRDAVAELPGEGNVNTERRATQGLHISSHFLGFPNCFPLSLPGSWLSLSPKKAPSLPPSPPKNSPDLWNNPQAAIKDSPKKQALQFQGSNIHTDLGRWRSEPRGTQSLLRMNNKLLN